MMTKSSYQKMYAKHYRCILVRELMSGRATSFELLISLHVMCVTFSAMVSTTILLYSLNNMCSQFVKIYFLPSVDTPAGGS